MQVLKWCHAGMHMLSMQNIPILKIGMLQTNPLKMNLVLEIRIG